MYGHMSYFPKVIDYVARIGHGTINFRLAYLYQQYHWTLPTYFNYLGRFEGVPCILPGNDLIIPAWGTFPQLFVKQLQRVWGTGPGIYESIRVLSNGNVGARRHVMENYLVPVQNRHQQSEYILSYLILSHSHILHCFNDFNHFTGLPGLYPTLYNRGGNENYNPEGGHWYVSMDHGTGLIGQLTKEDRVQYTRPASIGHLGGEFGSSVSYHCILHDDLVESKCESLSNIGAHGHEHIVRGMLPLPIFGSSQYVFGPPGHTLTDLQVTEYARNYRPLDHPVRYWLERTNDK
jgi:hypothetical protein